MGCINDKSKPQSHSNILLNRFQLRQNAKPMNKTQDSFPNQHQAINFDNINMDPSVESVNNSDRPQWRSILPIKQEQFHVRENVPDLSAINIIFSSDAHQLQNNNKLNKPLSRILSRQQNEASPLKPLSRKLSFEDKSKSLYIENNQGSNIHDIYANQQPLGLNIVKFVPVLEKDSNIFFEQRRLDILDYNIKITKIQINPVFPLNHQR